jgi:hypothetical protein
LQTTIGAEWNNWARYELYMALDKTFNSPCLVTHGAEIWNKGREEVDVLLEPRDSKINPIAIKLRCERVSENAGSFENFREQMDADMAKIKELGDVQGYYEGARLLLVGFSSAPPAVPNELSEFKTKPEPKHFMAGDVHGWVMEYDLPSEK